MRLIASFLACSILFFGCELLDPFPGPEAIGTTKPQIIADDGVVSEAIGKVVYDDNCARCHGDKAQGTPIWPPTITNKTAISTIVKNGKGSMPAFTTLTTSQIASVEKYLGSISPVVDITKLSATQLYASQCASCHGTKGEGTATWPKSIAKQTGIATIVRNGKGLMTAFPTVTNAQITGLEALLATFTPTDFSKLTGQQYYAADCASCHGASGEGTTKGYQIQLPVVGYATAITRGGRKGPPFADPMPAYTTAQLSDKQLSEMLTWLRAIPKPTTGKGLYTVFCANCHGNDGRGGITGRNIKNDTFLNPVRSGFGGTSYTNRSIYMPSWSVSEMTNAEVTLMQTYVRSL